MLKCNFNACLFRDNDVHPSDVCLLRHSLFAMNIMQISGYFQVDQIRWEQEGIASQFDGELCRRMIGMSFLKHSFLHSGFLKTDIFL